MIAIMSFRDRKLLTLGNLTIITQSLNASIRDSGLGNKKTRKELEGGLHWRFGKYNGRLCLENGKTATADLICAALSLSLP